MLALRLQVGQSYCQSPNGDFLSKHSNKRLTIGMVNVYTNNQMND
jgi:hypothetical protein